MNKLHSLGKRYWFPLLVFNSLLVVAAGSFITRLPKVWTSNAQIVLPENTNKVAVNLGTLGSLTSGDSLTASNASQLEVQKTILLSDVLMKRLWEADPEKTNFKGIADYKSLFTIKTSSKDAAAGTTNTLSLAVNGSSAELAKKRADALLQNYQKRLNELRHESRVVRENYSQDDLVQAAERLDQAQKELSQFKARTGLVNSDEQTKSVVNTMSTLTTTLAQANAQAQSNARRVQVLSDRLSLSPDQAIRSLGLGENKSYQFLRQRLVELDASLVVARSRFTDDSPLIQKLLIQRNDLIRQIQGYVSEAAGGQKIDTTTPADQGQGRALLMQQLVLAEAEANAQGQTTRVLQSYLNQLNGTLKGLPANQERLSNLQRRVEITEGIYKGLVAQVKQTSVDSFNSYPNVQVLDPPTVDAKPSGPKGSAIAISTLIAALLGNIALLLLLEARNPLLRPKDLKRMKFPMVVRIPRLRSVHKPLNLYHSPELEIQQLASTVSLQPTGNRRLLITSAMEGEGKTTMILNLAIALTNLGFRVLVVDADYRQQALSSQLGFVETLGPKTEPSTVKPGLDLLSVSSRAGNSPTLLELLTRGQFQQMLLDAETTGHYDYVLVDSPPIELTSEGILLASLIQQVLFVVRPGKSQRKPVTDSLQQLTQYNVNLIGLLINDLEAKSRTRNEYQSDDMAEKLRLNLAKLKNEMS